MVLILTSPSSLLDAIDGTRLPDVAPAVCGMVCSSSDKLPGAGSDFDGGQPDDDVAPMVAAALVERGSCGPLALLVVLDVTSPSSPLGVKIGGTGLADVTSSDIVCSPSDELAVLCSALAPDSEDGQPDGDILAVQGPAGPA